MLGCTLRGRAMIATRSGRLYFLPLFFSRHGSFTVERGTRVRRANTAQHDTGGSRSSALVIYWGTNHAMLVNTNQPNIADIKPWSASLQVFFYC